MWQARERRADELAPHDDDDDRGELDRGALVVQPIPAGGGRLKFLCAPDPHRSFARPLEPAAGKMAQTVQTNGYARLADVESPAVRVAQA